jgi:hypothetical protein
MAEQQVQIRMALIWHKLLCVRCLETVSMCHLVHTYLRVTWPLTCNASGSHKCSLFFIGKAKRPRCSFQPKQDLNMRNSNNSSAWMTTSEFNKFKRNSTRTNKGERGRQAPLITGNVPTHQVTSYEIEEVHGLSVINMLHTKIIFLPKNVTSAVQPLGQGIIAALIAAPTTAQAGAPETSRSQCARQ